MNNNNKEQLNASFPNVRLSFSRLMQLLPLISVVTFHRIMAIISKRQKDIFYAISISWLSFLFAWISIMKITNIWIYVYVCHNMECEMKTTNILKHSNVGSCSKPELVSSLTFASIFKMELHSLKFTVLIKTQYEFILVSSTFSPWRCHHKLPRALRWTGKGLRRFGRFIEK